MPSALRFSQGRKDFPFPSRKRGFFSYHWYSRSWLWRMFACFSWWEEMGASPPSLARSQLLSVSSLPPTEELSATTIHQREWTAFSSSLWSKVTSENSTPFRPKSEVMKSKRSKNWPHDLSPKLIHASANVASSLIRFTNISTFICPCVHAKSLQSCLTLCDPMNCSLPGSSVHRILQARILEWVAVPSSRGSSQTRAWTHFSRVSCIGRWVCYHWCHWGSHLRTCQMAIYLPSNLCSPGPTHCSE